MNARYRRRLARLLPAVVAMVVVFAGTIDAAELGAALVAAGLAAAFDLRVTGAARIWFRAPWRWLIAVVRAVPQMFSESALLARALGRRLRGIELAGHDDAARMASSGTDAMTAAIAASVYPCLTPNTVVRGVGRRGAVTGRKLLAVPGHALRDDLARLA